MSREHAERDKRVLRGTEPAVPLALHVVVGREQHKRVRDGAARGEVEQIGRRRIGPVQIFEDDEHGLPLGKAEQQLGEGVEQPRLELGGVSGARRLALGAQRRQEEGELRRGAARHRLKRRGGHLAQERHKTVGEERERNPGLHLKGAPVAMVKPWSRATSATASVRRVVPTPPWPAMMWTLPRPFLAASSAAVSVESSVRRPMRGKRASGSIRGGRARRGQRPPAARYR